MSCLAPKQVECVQFHHFMDFCNSAVNSHKIFSVSSKGIMVKFKTDALMALADRNNPLIIKLKHNLTFHCETKLAPVSTSVSSCILKTGLELWVLSTTII